MLFVTADQLVAHAVGDYVLQSDWMATEKTKRSLACLAHVATYVLPFLFLTRDPRALAIIVGTHFVIDRWRLARYICWIKNFLGPRRYLGEPGAREATLKLMGEIADAYRERNQLGDDVSVVASTPPFWSRRNWTWAESRATGYGPDKPDWMAVWLLIITDNVMHILCNATALYYFGAS